MKTQICLFDFILTLELELNTIDSIHYHNFLPS